MSETATSITFGEHGVRVMIEDTEIPHYATDIDQAKKEVTCWIPSEEGKVFSVEWLEVDVDYPSACFLHLDGYSVGAIMRQSHSAELIKFRRGWVSESSMAPFLFSKLAITDDDTYLDTSPSHSIGEIKLTIVRTSGTLVPYKVVPTTYLPPPQKVHERSKKAIAHQVNYGSETPANIKGSVKILEILVTFIFKYRPLEMLRANGIVPQPQERTLNTPPIPETSSGNGEYSKLKNEAESGSESDDEDSMREKALLAELEKIRKGKQLKDKRPKKKLKMEEKPVFTPGEIIDLT